jgi:hypothetical protein
LGRFGILFTILVCCTKKIWQPCSVASTAADMKGYEDEARLKKLFLGKTFVEKQERRLNPKAVTKVQNGTQTDRRGVLLLFYFEQKVCPEKSTENKYYHNILFFLGFFYIQITFCIV